MQAAGLIQDKQLQDNTSLLKRVCGLITIGWQPIISQSCLYNWLREILGTYLLLRKVLVSTVLMHRSTMAG